jgi:hypothetical protein
VTAVTALVPDLIDRSRIEAALGASGTPVAFVSGAAELVAAAADGTTTVIVDLAAPGVIDALAELASAHTIGFGAHVDRHLLRSARAAGCDEVLTRSAMFHRLPRLGAP